MEISKNKIIFQENQTYQQLELFNSSQDTLIFKIKITDTELFNISPPKGFLNPHQRIDVRILLNRTNNFQAKLLIAFAKVSQNQKNNFQQKWRLLSNKQIENIFVKIQRNIKKISTSKQQQRMKGVQFKPTDSPLLEPIQQQNLMKKSQSNNFSKIFSSLSQDNMQSMRSFDNFSIINPINPLNNSKRQFQASKLLNKQRQMNQIMRLKLVQNQKKLKYYQQLRQIQINSKLNQQKSDQKTIYLNIFLGVFICLLIGYFLTKINPQNQSMK